MSVLPMPGVLNPAAQKAAAAERRHRVWIFLSYTVCLALLASIAFYGWQYYLLSPGERPYSPLHRQLRPSGLYGINMGVLGVAMFAVLFFYPLRKRIPWLARRGNAQHWLDFHIVLGLTGPALIAFHASFKFHGVAGMAFWLMLAVAISGLVGRYLYAQVPASIHSAETSMRELNEQQDAYNSDALLSRRFDPAQLFAAFHVPSAAEVKRMSLLGSLLRMAWFDVTRPAHIAALRRSALHGASLWLTLGGWLSSRDTELESILRSAIRKASLAKRIVFLSRAQQTLLLWHVVHRPFSYSFLVLAIIHITIAMGLGFI